MYFLELLHILKQNKMSSSSKVGGLKPPQPPWLHRPCNKARKWKADTKLINTSFVEQNIYCLKNFQMQSGVAKQSLMMNSKNDHKMIFKPFASP